MANEVNLGAVGLEFAVRVALAVRCRGLAYLAEEAHMMRTATDLLNQKAIEPDRELTDCFNAICQDFRLQPDAVDELRLRIFFTNIVSG